MLNSSSGIPELVIEQSADGSPTLRLGKRYLHSRREPLREAERVIESLFNDDADIILLFGLGYGYFADAILKQKRAEQILLIIIPSREYGLRLFSLKDFTAFDTRNDIILFSLEDNSEIIAYLDQNPSALIQIIRHRALYQLYKREYEQLEVQVSEFLSRREVNKSTLKKFGKQWIRNLSANLSILSHCQSLDIWKNRFKGCPALIIAAGPSLQDILPYLEELASRSVVICVDTALQTILKTGIEPDFVLVSDPQYWNSRHLDYCHKNKVSLISDLTVHPDVFRKMKGQIYLGASAFPLGNRIEQAVGISYKLGSGGSVATSAWDFARFTGVSEAFFCGLDLGFPDKHTHYKGSQFEIRANNLGHRLVPAETHAWFALYSCHPYLVPDYQKKMVMTDKRMSIYIKWFGFRTGKETNMKTLTLSPGGVKVDGIDYLSPKNFLQEKQIIRPVINKKINDTQQNSKTPDSAKAEKIIKEIILKMGHLSEQVTRAIELNTRLEIAIKNNQAVNEIIQELDSIDSELLNSPYKDAAGFLLMSLLDEFQADKSDDILTRSQKLYSNLKETLDLHIKHLSRHIFS